MPRIRTIKPTFFQSDDVSVLPLRARLTWIGLWTQCDDQGRTKDHARLVKAAIWPLDAEVSLADIEDDLTTLARHGRIVRYEVAGHRYLEVVNWHDHQSINRPSKSTIPAPPIDSMNGHGTLTEGSRGERKGKEGKGREGTRARDDPPPAPVEPSSKPPPRCPKHLNDQDPPPCRACGDARITLVTWEADDQKHRRDTGLIAASSRARDQAEGARLAIDACRECGPDGYLPGGAVCPHDPQATDRARRGAAAARAALHQPKGTE